MIENKDIKQPNKGLNLSIQEAKEGIAEVINKYQLPPGILLMVLNEFVGQMQMQNARLIEAEKRAYQEEVKKNGEKVCKA